MSPVASSTDEHSAARPSSSNASKKSPSGRLTSPAAYVFAPSWMSNSKESHKPSNLAFSSFSTTITGSPNAIFPQRTVSVKTQNPAPRSSNSSPYPGCPLHELQPKPQHDNSATTTTTTTTTTTNTTTTTTTPATITTTATPPSSYRSKQPDSSGSLQESEFPTLGEDAASDKRHSGRSAWSNPNAIKAKVLCPPTTASDESNAEIPLSPYDIELERLKALVPKRRSGTPSSSSKRLSHHHHHHNHHHHNHHNHHHHHPSSPLISPTPSRSLSSTQRMRPNSKQSAAMRNSGSGSSNNYSTTSNNNSSSGNTSSNSITSTSNGNIRTSPLTKLPLQLSSKETAVVKLPAASSSSRPKRASSSGSSISSIHSQHSTYEQRLETPPRICELTDDTTTTTSGSSLLESPRTLMEEDIMEEDSVVAVDRHDAIEVCGVNEHEREHFVSWVRAWASRPAEKAAATMEVSVINPRFFGSCGEYSYFGPLEHHRISR